MRLYDWVVSRCKRRPAPLCTVDTTLFDTRVKRNVTNYRLRWLVPKVSTSLYLAGPYPDKLEIRAVGEQLRQRGYTVSSSWIWSDHEIPAELGGDAASYNNPHVARWLEENCAVPDLHDLDQAMTMVVFTCFSDKLSRGGHDFETGYAWAKGKLIVLVGPRRSVFHTMIGVTHFKTVEEFLAEWLRGQGPKELG